VTPQLMQIAEMSGFYVSDEGIVYSKDRSVIQNDELEQFANFIISQCISTCHTVGTMAEITNDGEMARKTKATADTCEILIKQYFGIKDKDEN